ncbi:MAG: MFS transporter [Chloroherpetonaceae bacterium]|nr:MFS transporter [Chloroherpetonaceae bacterium]
MRAYFRHIAGFQRDAKIFLLGSFLFSTGTAINDLLFNLYLKERGLKESFIGSSVSTLALGIMLMAIPSAFMAKRFSPRRMLIFCAAFEAFLYSARAASSNPISIPIYNVLIGAAGASLRILPASVMMTLAEKHERPYLFGLNSAFQMAGLMVGNFLGGYSPETFFWILSAILFPISSVASYQLGLALSTVVMLASSAVFSKLHAERNPLPMNFVANNPQKTFVKLQAIPLFFQRVVLGVQVPFKIFHHVYGDIKSNWPERHTRKALVSIIFPHTLVAIGAGATIPFIPLFLKTDFMLSPSTIGSIMSGVQAAVSLGYVASPLVTKRLGVLRSIIVVQAASLPFMAIVGFGESLIWAVFALGFRNVLMNMSSPFIDQYNMESVHESQRQLISSLDHFLWNAAWSVMPFIAGFVIEWVGYEPLFAFTIVLYAASSLLYYRRYRERHLIHL